MGMFGTLLCTKTTAFAEEVLQSEMGLMAPGFLTGERFTPGIFAMSATSESGCSRATGGAGGGWRRDEDIYGGSSMEERLDEEHTSTDVDIVGGEVIDHEEMLQLYEELRLELLQEGTPRRCAGIAAWCAMFVAVA